MGFIVKRGARHAKGTAGFFYGQPQGLRELSCVVTGASDPNWHHLDENQSNWHAANIIPLAASLNQLLDKRRFRGLPLDLMPAVLAEKARDHHFRGRFAQGYACARLGAFLMMPPRGDPPFGADNDPDAALAFCAAALCSLRPLSAIPFATDTLSRNSIPVLKSWGPRIRMLTLARLIAELESYYRDHGWVTRALVCCDLVDQLLGECTSTVEASLKARVQQHRAIAMLVQNAVSTSDLERMDEAYKAIEEVGTYIEGPANHYVWKTRSLLSRIGAETASDRRRIQDSCSSMINSVYLLKDRKQVGAWTYAEAVWTDAEWNLAMGRKRESHDIVALGTQLFHSAGIVPSALFAPRSVQSFKEKYPRDLYTSPRNTVGLARFTKEAEEVISLTRVLLA